MSHRSTVATIAAAAESVGPRCGATTVMAIDGPAGSGKTTLAGQLAPRLEAQLVHMDDLYEGWGGLEESVHLLHDGILEPLSRGKSGEYRRYDWHRGQRAEVRQITPARALIIEGVGSVRVRTHGYYATIVWVQAPDELRLDRTLARDGAAAEAQLRQWMRQEQEVFAETGTPRLANIHVDAWGRICTDE